MKYFVALILVFILLFVSQPAYAQSLQPITPTLFCLGSCPTQAVSQMPGTGANPTSSTSPTSPSGSNTQPSTTQITATPPCTASVQSEAVHTFKKHTHPTGGLSQLITLLLQLILRLLEKFLGINLQLPTTGTPQPTSAPASPVPSSAVPSGPAPTVNPCVTQAPQPTVPSQPSQTQPTQGTQPTTTTTGSPVTTPPASSVQPDGPSGNWKLVWSDEFNGTSLDTSKWYVFNNVVRQGVTCYASNISESGGYLHITLASSSSGGEINSWNTQGAGKPSNGFGLAYGDAVEARVYIPGSGSSVPNWPSFWTSGHTQPGDFSGGEIDIFEGLSGGLHIDYNNTNDSVVGPKPSGSWIGGWHTYTAVRHGPASAATYDVYWDGKLVWHTGPHVETGNILQGILLTNGYSSKFGGPLQVPTTMLVDYVRAWTP